MKRLLFALLLSCTVIGLRAEAVAAGCSILPAAPSSKDGGKAERFDGLTATRLMQAMLAESNLAGPLVDLDTFEVPKVDTLFALPVGREVLFVRVRGTTVCADDPVDIHLFESAKFRVLPAEA
ncbi:MAG: hypothetical protein U1E56_01105 [Bauldia sp.]